MGINELPDKKSRSEAKWRWLGARKRALEQYVWPVQRHEMMRVPDASHVSNMLNIWNASATPDEQQPKKEKSDRHL